MTPASRATTVGVGAPSLTPPSPLPSPDRGGAPPEGRVPALDGVRGIAVALVLFTHLWKPVPSMLLADRLMGRAASMGWIGVDLFFVLSGYLITGILLDSRGHAGYYRSFYARRVLRLIPVSYLYLALVFLVAPRLAPADFPAVPAHRQAWAWGYAVNLAVFWLDRVRLPPTVGHFWSLAVEEQFYLVWPFVVLRLDPRRLTRVAVAIVVAAPLLRLVLVLAGAGTPILYASTFTRADALAAGALVAVAIRDPRGRALLDRWSRPVALAALPLLVLIVGVWHGALTRPMQVVGFSVNAAGFAAFVALVVRRRGGERLHALLTTRVLRALGRYSYCLYIVHPTVVYLLLRHGVRFDALPAVGGSRMPSALAFMATGVAISVAIAWVSWRVVEQPLSKLKRRFPRPAADGDERFGAWNDPSRASVTS